MCEILGLNELKEQQWYIQMCNTAETIRNKDLMTGGERGVWCLMQWIVNCLKNRQRNRKKERESHKYTRQKAHSF